MRLISLLSSNTLLAGWLPDLPSLISGSPTIMVSRPKRLSPTSFPSFAVASTMVSVTHQRSRRRRHRPPPPPRGEWPALTSVTHCDDTAARAHNLCIGLCWAKLASSTRPQKPPATYTRVNDFGRHTDSIFRGRLIGESDLYASIYGTLHATELVFLQKICDNKTKQWSQSVIFRQWQ